METNVWTALSFVLVCYVILAVMSLFVAFLIVVVRWATSPRTKPAEMPEAAKGRA